MWLRQKTFFFSADFFFFFFFFAAGAPRGAENNRITGPMGQVLQAMGLLSKPASLIVVGLDNAGKSMLINHLKPARNASFEVTATVGMSRESFTRGGFTFNVFDMAGGSTYRTLWETYYQGVDGIIFVVDSSDKLRLCVARDELDTLLGHKDIAGAPSVPMLFFANKMDLPGAQDPSEVSMQLGLTQLTRPWQIAASNALTGEGVNAGIDWLVQVLNKRGGGGEGGR